MKDMNERLELFAETLFQLDKQDLEKMLMELAWKECTIDDLIDSIVRDCQD
jgi:hypothetical protein